MRPGLQVDTGLGGSISKTRAWLTSTVIISGGVLCKPARSTEAKCLSGSSALNPIYIINLVTFALLQLLLGITDSRAHQPNQFPAPTDM